MEYKIYDKNNLIQKNVEFETWLLHNILQNPNNFSKSIKINNLLKDKTFSNMIPNNLQLKVIILKKNSGCVAITPMSTKTNIENITYLNDIWSNDKIITWVLSSDLKYYILGIRKGNFQGLQKNIYKFGYKRWKTIKKKINNFKNTNLLDFNDKDNLYITTNKYFLKSLKKRKKSYCNYIKTKHNISCPSNIDAYYIKPLTMYFILPKLPLFLLKLYNENNFDDYHLELQKISNTQIDILTANTGNVTMIWSKDISSKIKTMRKMISLKYNN
jgi:hypothetical protein